jgi:tellurite resistance protein
MTEKASIDATAACGAYLLVAWADAWVASVEEARFLGGIVNDATFRHISAPALASEYARLYAALGEDYSATEAEIVGAIAAVKNDARAVEAVKLAARHAVVADQRLKPQEDLALARIACALGIAADDL